MHAQTNPREGLGPGPHGLSLEISSVDVLDRLWSCLYGTMISGMASVILRQGIKCALSS